MDATNANGEGEGMKLWNLCVDAKDSKGSGGSWYFERRPTQLQCEQMFFSVAGDYPAGVAAKYTLREVPMNGQTTTPLPH